MLSPPLSLRVRLSVHLPHTRAVITCGTRLGHLLPSVAVTLSHCFRKKDCEGLQANFDAMLANAETQAGLKAMGRLGNRAPSLQPAQGVSLLTRVLQFAKYVRVPEHSVASSSLEVHGPCSMYWFAR